MLPLAEVAQVQAADAAAAEAGIPVATLMARAGAAVARAARDLAGGAAGRRVVAVAGKGHNGGDALEALVRLARAGAGVEALLAADPARVGGEVGRLAAEVAAAGGRVRPFQPALAERLLGQADLVIDGLLGTGTRGAPRGPVAEAIAAVNEAGKPVVAVDIPSGVDGATGAVPGGAVRATVTVTFQALKPGHVLAPGSELAGRVELADIGLPLGPLAWGVSQAADLVELLPRLPFETHKRRRGVLLVVAGGPGMVGAATLVGWGARRAGTGLLVLAVPERAEQRVGAAVPEALTLALPEEGGAITAAAADTCAGWLAQATALAIGPGLGRAPGTRQAVLKLLSSFAGPAVVDADALFALGAGEPLRDRPGPTLLTPHEGEFARLAPAAQGTRLHRAAAQAAAWDACVLLKGRHTVIAEPGGRLAVNPTGTPVLATGGTGDVLTGAAGALLAQGLAPFDAARLAAWVHGRAGSLAAERLGPLSVAASDVAEHLPAAFQELVALPGR